MFGFGLLNPLFLLGLAAAAIPIVIHLIHKRHSRSVDFPSLMFLRLIDLRMASRQRLRELIVLALRVAAITLFAFALAKPILRTRTADAGSRTSTTAVVIIDNSFSMGYKESGVTSLERAKEKAQQVLDTLAPGDTAAVIPVAGYAPADAQLSRDLAGLARRVKLLKEEPVAGSLEGALNLALKALADSTELNRELYIVSDFQLSLWEPVLEGGTLRELDADVVVADVAPKAPVNMAVTSVEIGHVPGEAGAMEIEAQIHNHSGSDLKGRVALVLDGKTRSEKAVSVPPDTDAAVSFTHNASEGRLQGYVFLKTDGLPADNKRYFASSAGEAIRVLVVNGSPSDIWDLDETYYLVTALAPGLNISGAPGRGGASSPVRPAVVSENGLRRERLDDYSAVLLANIRHVDETLASDLREFVRQGGGLVVFSGDQVRPEDYNSAFQGGPEPGLLPCSLVGTREYPESTEQSVSLVPVDWEHPIFSALKEVRNESFANVRFSRLMISEEVKEEETVSVLARFSNGFPALLERRLGAGSVLFFASTCDRDWTNLPLRPVYLPLVHQIVRHIAGKQQRLKSYLVGEPVKYIFPPTEKSVDVAVTDPAGRTFEADVKPSGAAISATFPDTVIPGIYNAAVKTSAGKAGEYFAVNVDVSESDLSRVTRGQAKESLGPDVIRIEGEDDLVSAIWRMRTGVKLWDYFFYLALLALLAEGWLANRFVPHTTEPKVTSGGRVTLSSKAESIRVG